MVEYAELFLHHKDGEIKYVNCKLAENLNLSVVPSISESQARTYATNHLGNTLTYTWEDSAWEADYKDLKKDTNATTFKLGELVIAKEHADSDYNTYEFKLAWKFSIEAVDTNINVEIYVDALSGIIIKKLNNIQDGLADLGLGYGSSKSIDTRFRGGLWNHHVLRSDDANSPKIWTKKAKENSRLFGGYNSRGATPYNSFDGDDIWGSERSAVTTPHYLASEVWKYYQNTFNINGMDNNGSEVLVLGDMNEVNSRWISGDNMITFGRVNGLELSTKDFVGHEFTHGVVASTAGLVYSNESGALNESFADILGYDFERSLNNGIHTNWNIGEDANHIVRKMNNPSNSMPNTTCPDYYNQTQPAFYKGQRYYYGTCDEGGVHFNSGVQNYWFYLLTSGSNNAPDGTFANIQVNGIGVVKARDIAFYNLTTFLGKNSTYEDAKNGSIFSALSKYGRCSEEYKQTKNAWAAVGVGQPILPITITGPSTINYYIASGNIAGNLPVNYVASGDDGSRYVWTSNPVWTTVTSRSPNSPMFANILSITNFNNNFINSTISVSSSKGCETATKNIYFHALDQTQPGGGNGSNGTTFSLMPNPTTGTIHVDADFANSEPNSTVHIAIVDAFGTLIFQQSYGEDLPSQIDVSFLMSGNYVLQASKGSIVYHIEFTKL